MTLGLITLPTAALSFTLEAAETIGAFALAEMRYQIIPSELIFMSKPSRRLVATHTQ
jgi:hypothetical protein